jgi:sarcosine oxidase subunit alpha
VFRRSRALIDPVTIHLDGEPVAAERGEPIAQALLAADKTILARSPKLHRPRGASCFRGGCDGCLARVDGAPNVITCQTPVRGGEHVSAQNVIGSRKADLLRVTDWFFPAGIDHHHMLAGVPGLSTVMQGVAEKIAGMGRLPSAVEPPHAARRLAVDVAVVGGGVAGIAAASALVAAGRKVALVDDGVTLGGALAALPRQAAELFAACPLVGVGVEVFARSVAAGCFEGELLVVTSAPEAVLIRPRAMIFASGAHDGVLAVPGNDLPGIFSARALCRLLHAGLEPDGPVAVVGSGFWADACVRAVGEPHPITVSPEQVVDVRGTAGVRTITVREPGGELLQHPVVVVAVAIPGAPAFELAVQAGAKTRFDPSMGYVVSTDARGRCAENAWAVGEVAGRSFDPDALQAEGRAVAADVLAALG